MVELTNYILDLFEWDTPATPYSEREVGSFRIHRGRYPRGMYQNYGIDDFIFFKAHRPLPITFLEEKRGKRWYSWMLDDPPHWRAMEIYAEHSKGRVLTTGLGLGLYLQALGNNNTVTEITVVERSPEIISLIEPYLPPLPNLTILQKDFYEFLNQDSSQWDTIMVDLWVAHGIKEKLDILYHEVLPMAVVLRLKYPKASITFHGFPTVSDIQHTSCAMIEVIMKMNSPQASSLTGSDVR